MNKIKEYRKKKQLSQVQLAEQLKVTQACVAQWESGTALPTSDKLPLIARALGCTIDDLYN